MRSKISGRVNPDDAAARAAIEQRAQADAERKLADASDATKRELEERTAARLLEVWRELRAEVDDAVNVTTRRALEQRASELGSIESIEEGRDKDRGYELTITVRT